MSETTMESEEQIKAFIDAVLKRLDEDVFLRYENSYFATHTIYDVMDKKRTPLIVRDFYRDYIFISVVMAQQIDKNVNYSIRLNQAYNAEFSGPWFHKDDNMANVYIPRDLFWEVSGAIYNVKETRKVRHKVVLRTQQYHRNFIRARFEHVL